MKVHSGFTIYSANIQGIKNNCELQIEINFLKSIIIKYFHLSVVVVSFCKTKTKTSGWNKNLFRNVFSSALSNICAITNWFRAITAQERKRNNLLRLTLVENGNSRSVFFYRSLSYEVRFFKYRDNTHQYT